MLKTLNLFTMLKRNLRKLLIKLEKIQLYKMFENQFPKKLTMYFIGIKMMIKKVIIKMIDLLVMNK